MDAPRYAVLLCDDDRLILATVSSALRSAGLQVIEADNGDDAILLARQHRPDLAMLDMRMDGKSGLDVAAYLRDYVGTPFLFLSAFGDDESVRQAKAFGALDYLVKPMDSRRIVETVRRLLDGLASGPSGARDTGPLEVGSETTREGGVIDSPVAAAPAAATVAAPVAAAAAAPVPAPIVRSDPPRSAPSDPSPIAWLAVGVLMERHGLVRQAAVDRLAALARASRRPVDVVADDLVTRLERINAERTVAAPKG